MNLGNDVYTDDGRRRLSLLYIFTVLGICASVATLSTVTGLSAGVAAAVMVLGTLILALLFAFNREVRKAEIRWVYAFSMANLILLLLLVVAL